MRVKVVDRPGGRTAKAEADDAIAQETHATRAGLRRAAEAGDVHAVPARLSAVPALVALAVLAYRRRSLALAVWVALGVTIFVAAPHWRVAGDLEGPYVQGRDWPLVLVSSSL